MDHAVACREGDRQACDSFEFEGAAAAGPLPLLGSRSAASELAVVLIPLLAIGLATRWMHSRSGGGLGPSSAARPRARRVQAVAVGSPAGLASPSATAPAAPKPSKPPPRAAIAPGGSGSSAGSLLAAADAAVSLLLWPLSIAQAVLGVRGRRAAAAGPLASPAAAGALAGHGTPGSSGGRGVRYGLGWGEAESEDEGEEGGESELTAAALRRLQASPEFRCYLQARGLTPADITAETRRLRLYRKLRRCAPAAFWQLVAPGSRRVYDSRVPSRLVLAADYLLSASATLAVGAAAYRAAVALPPPAGPAAAAALVLVALWVQWVRARPPTGALFGLFYEELRWGHAAPGWRCAASALLEAAYLLGSLGAGLPVSLALRCFHAGRQSVGELVAGVGAVQEVAVDTADG